MRRLSDDEIDAMAAWMAEHTGDIADEARQNVYDELKRIGAPEAEIEAARLELDTSIDAMVEQRIAELLGTEKRTLN
jgi:hypothetical protein